MKAVHVFAPRSSTLLPAQLSVCRSFREGQSRVTLSFLPTIRLSNCAHIGSLRTPKCLSGRPGIPASSIGTHAARPVTNSDFRLVVCCDDPEWAEKARTLGGYIVCVTVVKSPYRKWSCAWRPVSGLLMKLPVIASNGKGTLQGTVVSNLTSS
jgi:hypothetical protein